MLYFIPQFIAFRLLSGVWGEGSQNALPEMKAPGTKLGPIGVLQIQVSTELADTQKCV